MRACSRTSAARPSGWLRLVADDRAPRLSFGRDPGLFRYPAPLLHLALDIAEELGRRAALNLDAAGDQLGTHVRRRQRLVDLGIELGDGLLGRSSGRQDAAPGVGVVTGKTRLGDGRQVWQRRRTLCGRDSE